MKATTLLILLFVVATVSFGYDVIGPAKDQGKYNWSLRTGIEGTINPSTFIFPVDLYYSLPLKALQDRKGLFRNSHARFGIKNRFSLGYNDTTIDAKLVPLNFLEIGAGITFRAHYNWVNMGYRRLESYTNNYTEPIGSGTNEVGMHYTVNMRLMADISFVTLENNTVLTFNQYEPFVSGNEEYLLDTHPLAYLPVKKNDIRISNDTVVLFSINDIFSVGLHNLIQGVISTGQISDRVNVVGTVDVPLLNDDYLWFYGKLYAGFYVYDPYYSLLVTAYVDGGIRLLF